MNRTRGPCRARREHGHAMAALIVAMSVMSLMISAAMPVWKHAAQREKEEELIFRGQQYVHAIALFQRKFANAAAPSIDVLVEQRFLRKKYKDPITNDDFVPVTLAQAAASGVAGAPAAGQRGRDEGRGTSTGAGRARPPQPARGAARGGGLSAGSTPGIIGVTSKSNGQSIRLYNGRNHYNEWAFVYMQPLMQPGQPSTSPPGVLGGQGGERLQPGPPRSGETGQRGSDRFGRGLEATPLRRGRAAPILPPPSRGRE